MRVNYQTPNSLKTNASEADPGVQKGDVGQILLRVESRLSSVESTLTELKSAVQAPRNEKQWYSTAEAAAISIVLSSPFANGAANAEFMPKSALAGEEMPKNGPFPMPNCSDSETKDYCRSQWHTRHRN